MIVGLDAGSAVPVRADDRGGPPRLGVVLCDLDHYAATSWRCRPGDVDDQTPWPPGFFENPRTWGGLDVTYAVAEGARVTSLIAGDPAVTTGFVDAAAQLESCALVISDCGFFLHARDRAPSLPASVVTSSLELLPMAARLTTADVGVLTFSAPAAENVLRDHVLRDRLRIVGLTGAAGWSAIEADDFGLEHGWSVGSLSAGLEATLERAFAPDGAFAGIGALVLECTLLPQFRRLIRRHTTRPIVDLASFAFSVLGVEHGVPQCDDGADREAGA